MFLSSATQQLLDDKLNKLNALRPISASILVKLQEQFQIEMTYNSNAIEGNSLTQKETFWVVQEGITIKEKPLKDHLEAKNHQEALDFLYEIIQDTERSTLSAHLIKQLHILVVRDSQRDIAGKYRDGDVMITGADHTPPGHIKVPSLMNDMIRKYSQKDKKMHIIERAAFLHHRLAYIHPFWDGNGRCARLVMNLLIMNAGYPIAIVLKNDRKRYYRCLSLADEGDYEPLCEFIAQAVIRSLNIYLSVLSPQYSREEIWIPLREAAEESPYSSQYLRKLATQGKIEAMKKGRNWYTSKKAIEEYRKNRQRKR